MQSVVRALLHVMLLASVILGALLMVPSSIHHVYAIGTLFIDPPQKGPFAAGTTFTYRVNVTGMDPFSAWDISVTLTNSSVLTPVSLSVANNILGSVTEVANCINGVGSGCSIKDGAGVAHSAAAANSGIDVGGSGLLFTITYQVVRSGYSFLRIPTGLDTLGNSAASKVAHSTIGGLYGTPPPLPVAYFTIAPPSPHPGDNVTLDASLSTDPNAGATITKYEWTLNRVEGGFAVTNTTFQPKWVYFIPSDRALGAYFVELVVIDSLGLSSQPVDHPMTVIEKQTSDLRISDLRASPQDNIIPGTPVAITATVFNKGTLPESSFNLTIFLDGRFFRTLNYTGAPILHEQNVDKTFILDTTGLRPNSYDLVGKIQPSTDPRSNNYLTIRFIVPIQGAPIPLTVPEFIGLIIAVLAVVGVVRLQINRLRVKRRLRELELS